MSILRSTSSRYKEIKLTSTAVEAIEDALHVDDQNQSIRGMPESAKVYGRELKWLKQRKAVPP